MDIALVYGIHALHLCGCRVLAGLSNEFLPQFIPAVTPTMNLSCDVSSFTFVVLCRLP
jgi:hypothetical protein